MRVDVVVIGAGVAGLTAARALERAGAGALVLEARERIGGRVWTVRDFAATPVEAGAEFIHGVEAATWDDVRTAGLRVQSVPYIQASWFNLGGRTRWLPWELAHPGVWRAFDILRSIRRARAPDHSAEELIRRKGYRGRARQLAELTLTAHLPGSTEEVGVLGLIEDGVLHLEEGLNHRILDGYDRLPAHIAGGLSIELGQRVTAIAWAPDGVSVHTASGLDVEATIAISTLPHGVLRSGAVTFEPDLPAARHDAIARVRSGPVVKVLLAFEESFWPAKMAQLVVGRGPVTLYWPTSFGTDGPPLLTAYATGPRARRLADAGGERAVEVVLDDLRRLFPSARPRRLLRASRVVDWSDDPFALGGYTFLPPGATGARKRLAEPDTGALLWAGSATVSQPIAATVEAAYRSGLRAADQALSILSDQ